MILDTLLILALACIAIALFTGKSVNINITTTHKHIVEEPPTTLQEVPEPDPRDMIEGLAESIQTFLNGGDVSGDD